MNALAELTTDQLRRHVADLDRQRIEALQALKLRLDEDYAVDSKRLRQTETERNDVAAKLAPSAQRAVGKKKLVSDSTATRENMVEAAVKLVADNPPGLEAATLTGLVKSHLTGKDLQLTGAFRHLATYLAQDGRLTIDAAGRYVLAVKAKPHVA